jgi:hypothetical protein
MKTWKTWSASIKVLPGFFDNILLRNYSLFREDMRIRSGNVERIVERCTSAGKVTLLDGDFLDSVDILINRQLRFTAHRSTSQ